MEFDNKMILRDICDESKIFTLEDKTPFFLGRNKETQIQDTRCSRTQMVLTPNYETGDVLVEQLGGNPSAINGQPLQKGTKRKAGPDDIIEVLQANYFFKIDFKHKIDKNLKSEIEADSVELNESEISHASPGSKKTDSQSLPTPKIQMSNTNNSSEPAMQKAIKNNKPTGSLDHFLKDSALKSGGSWKKLYQNSCLIFTPDNIICREKIAAFDLDGTIITTNSGNVYPKDEYDWKLMFPSTKDKLEELHRSNYKLVFFTNQGGIQRGKIKIPNFQKKIEAIVRKLQVPVQVFVSGMDDIYRKPRPGMWNLLIESENNNVPVNHDESFFCGDAAGRPANCEPNKKKKDFSISDRLFAMNSNLKFFTPEEYFLGWTPAPFDLPEFNPVTLPVGINLLDPATTEFPSKKQEIIVMVGCPGSGKSFFSKTYAESAGYVYVNRDTLKTWQKCVSLTEKSVKNKLSVVVDNTSPDKDSRARYTKIAKEYNIKIRIFWMATSLEHAKHNNTFRQILKEDDAHDYIPNHSINQFFNILDPPTLDEGFDEIVRVNFIPKFESDKHKKLYNMYLLEGKY